MATNLDKAEREALEPIAAAAFEEHLDSIYAYLERLLGDRDRADEVGLHALVAAQQAVGQLPGIAGRRAWLYGIATGSALRALLPAHARFLARRARASRLHRDPSQPDGAQSGAVEASLRDLPPEPRATLLLYSYSGLSLTEVALALHASEGAAKAALYQARRLFKAAHGAPATGGHADVEEELAVYDSLGQEQQAELSKHLSTCPGCAAELTAYRRMDRSLAALSRARPGERLHAAVLAWTRRTARRNVPEPVTRPVPAALPPPPPDPSPAPAHDQPAGPPPSVRWQRLVLPVAMALLFVASLWAGMRGEDKPDRVRNDKPPAPAVTTNTLVAKTLPLSLTSPLQPVDATSPVTLTFACEDVAPYQTLVQQFQAENLDVTVRLLTTGQVVKNRQTRAASLGSRSSLESYVALANQTDVFCAPNDPALQLDGLVRDLGPLARADDSFLLGDFYAAVIQRATVAGTLYMIPARFRPVLIGYDPAAFQAAGLPAPRPGWSWDDLLHAATVLTERDGSTVKRWGFGSASDQFLLARFFSATTSPLAAGSLALANPFLNPEVRALFEWFDELYYKKPVAPLPATLAVPGPSAFPGGAPDASPPSAMWVDSSGGPAPTGARTVPFPVGRAFDGTTPVGPVEGWAISSQTPHLDAAWRWIAYLSQHLPQASGPLEVPARRSVPQMQEFWHALPPADRDTYAYALEHLGEWPDMAQVPGMLPLYTELLSMIRGNTTFARLTSPAPTPPPAPVQPLQPVTITFAAPRDQIRNYARAAAQFAEVFPGIRVIVVPGNAPLGDEPGATSLFGQMRVLAHRVDAMLDPQVPALVRSGRSEGILYDVTGLVRATVRPEDYYSNTLEALQWQGQNWGLPDRFGLELIHFRQSMFRQMRVAYPQPGWTWSDFDRTIRAVTSQGGGHPSWWGFKEGSSSPLRLLVIRAGPLVDYSGARAAPLLDVEDTILTAGWYAGLLGDRMIAPADRAADDAAMWIGLTDPSVMDVLQGVGVGVAPLPVAPGSAATTPLELYDAYALSATTTHPKEAWQWLLYLQVHPVVTEARPAGIPARRDGVQARDLPTDPTLRAVIEYALEHTQQPAPLRPEEYLVTQQLAAALQQIVAGRLAHGAMKQAQAGAQADLSPD